MEDVALFNPTKIMSIYHHYDEGLLCHDETTEKLASILPLLNKLYQLNLLVEQSKQKTESMYMNS